MRSAPRPEPGGRPVDERPGHPMMASIVLVVGVSLLIVVLAVFSSL